MLVGTSHRQSTKFGIFIRFHAAKDTTSTCQRFLLQLKDEDDGTHTLPAEDMWSTPANTMFSGLWSISGSTESLLPVMILWFLPISTVPLAVSLMGKIS